MPEKNISDIFTANLKALLDKNNMNYKELAAKLGVKASSVSMWMTGNSLPRMGMLDKIADLFSVSVDSLVTNASEEPTTIAAHFDGDEYTEEELEKIKEFAAFVKANRKGNTPAKPIKDDTGENEGEFES